MKTLIVLVGIVGCVSLPHVDPQKRDISDQVKATVRIESRCGDYWDAVGTGVIISDRHVLTAAHVTNCPEIPDVHVMFYNGDTLRFVVTKEDVTRDISKLEIMSAVNIGLHVAPPLLEPTPWLPSDRDDWVCASLQRGFDCGVRQSPNKYASRLHPGDSGAGIYDYEHLIGLVTNDLPELNETEFTLVTSEWLEGT